MSLKNMKKSKWCKTSFEEYIISLDASKVFMRKNYFEKQNTKLMREIAYMDKSSTESPLSLLTVT